MEVLDDHIVEAGRAGTDIDHALDVFEAKRFVDIRFAQIAVDDDHAFAVRGKGEREIGRGERLSFSGNRAGHHDALGVLALVLQAQAGVEGEEGLGHLLVLVVDDDLRLVLLLHAANLGNDADEREADHRLDVEGALHAVVDEGDKESEGGAKGETAEEAERQIEGNVRGDRLHAGRGAVDDAGVLRLDGARHRGLAHARHDVVEQVLVDAEVALEIGILDGKTIKAE